MKAKFMVLTILLFGSLNAFSSAQIVCKLDETGEVSVPIPTRTFSAKKSVNPDVSMNFKSALFSISKSSVGLKANAPFYNLYLNESIDVAPGENKFWNLAGNTEIIDELDNQIEVDVQTAMNFKDCNYTKSYYLPFLGQSVKANEYYVIADGGIYAKGISIEAQAVNSSGITIYIPAQEVLYTPSKPVCYFPLTYDGITHTIPPYTRTIIAKVSGASALGIQDGTPVSYSVTFNDNYKVLAWGGLQLIDNEKPVNALLIQTESKTIGTISINGAKVPQSVLSHLKMAQDSASVSVNFSFRNMTYPDNVAEFGLDGDKVTYLTTIKTIK